jgi:predicted nucleic acid-binding protein
MDASALVDLFVAATNTRRIRSHLARRLTLPIVTDFAAGEFASAVKRYVVMGEMSSAEAGAVFGGFDAWCSANAELVTTEPGDIRLAAAQVRRLDVNLRMPDAMYLAVALRVRAPLCSFDAMQIAAARKFGVDVVAVD